MFRFQALVSLFFILLFSIPSLRAQKFTVEKGTIDFTSNAVLEMIKASTAKVQGVIDLSNNRFAFATDIISFQGFNSALQREHFNEKYMESDKYPRASFSGKIIEAIDLETESTYEVRAKGDLDIHGQKQTRIIKAKITVANGTLVVVADFIVPLSDHNITIPSIVSQKIATEIEVSVRTTMKGVAQ
jgi:hypothetical protein